MKLRMIDSTTSETKYSTLLLGYNLLIQMFLMNENNLFNSPCTSNFCFSKIVFVVQNCIQITWLCK